ncbi:hypothetical protein IJ579_03150 [bacterium]|nr:hypothetical protein [bacterium]
METKKKKKDICVDFDGVLNKYTGWKGEDELFDIREGCEEFLQKLYESYNITILTTRNPEKVQDWLKKYNVEKYIKQVTNKKVPAVLYVDDRGLQFNGNFNDTLNQIENFKTHYEKTDF